MFRDREDAGQRLASRLANVELVDPLVLGIPRGGVVIAAVVARAIGADVDVVLSRKLRARWQPELAIGAVGEDGAVYIEPAGRLAAGSTPGYVDRERQHQLEEIRRRSELVRAVRPRAPVAGRSVIITDDGIATGSTMIAALHTLRAMGPQELIVAVPVAAAESVRRLQDTCDRVICLEQPAIFWAISQFYDRFDQVSDEEVLSLLREFAPSPSRSSAASDQGAAP
jgi:predicted phosphoribosyltransferase